MPIVDKPLHELKVYQGINPKPADFDEFWEKSLEEMRNVERNVEIIKADFQAPGSTCYDLYFTGVKGARIHSQLIVPDNIKGKAPALIQFHGYSGWTGEFCDKLNWTSCGFVVAAMDCRGQGGYSEDVGGVKGTTQNGLIIRGLDDCPENLYFRDVFLDTAELADIIMNLEYVDETKVGVYGGSQGGGLTLACASLEPRIAKAFADYPFLSDYKRVWEMDLAKDAYAELRTFFRNFDSRHEKEDEIFTRLGYIDIQNLTPRIKAEVTMATGLMDTICPPSTQFAALNKITSKKHSLIYPDYGHEYLRGNNEKRMEFFFDLLK